MSSVKTTFGEAIARLEAFDRKAMPKAFKRAFYRALDEGRKAAIADLQRSRIGAMVRRRGDRQVELAFSTAGHYSMDRLEAMRESVIPLVIRRSELKERTFSGGKSLTSGLQADGFAALIAKGGKTKSHQIKPIRLEGYSRRRSKRFAQLMAGGYMTFQIGGRWVSKRVVTHPGSRVARQMFLEAGAAKAERSLGAELERSVGEAVREAGL